MPRTIWTSLTVVALASAAVVACVVDRSPSAPPTWDGEVGAIVARRCNDCHRGKAWSGGSYLGAIACVRSGEPAVLPPDDGAPIARALADATHAGVASDAERASILAWVRGGAPKLAGTVHDPSFVDPRSERSHGRALRAERWRSMLDATSDGACGRCHEGAPSGRTPRVATTAPGATACTTCHVAQGGALACPTCHGDVARAAPPRDRCFFPGDLATAGAHLAHVDASGSRAAGIACATCHPTPAATSPMSGVHGDGRADVALAEVHAGAPPSYDASGKRCATSCHARPGGAKPSVAWSDRGPLGCGDCHGAPPPKHYEGACTSCHREADAKGTALAKPTLHANGKVDLGDGSGRCGACHGEGDDPWPKTGAHASHRAPPDAAPVACEACHDVPKAYGPGTGHPRGGPAKVAFSGLARARGASPTYEGTTCKSVYCHGAGVTGTAPTARDWYDTSGAARRCDGCHASPPGAPHTGATSCWSCHPSVIDPGPKGPVVAVPSRHVDGETDR